MRTARIAGRHRRTALVASVAALVGAVGVAAPAAADEDGETHRVYATREGLVGRTTANGHVITERDHFVALPSARALSPQRSGATSVRVCVAGTTRCEYAPVWDVGPWNTTDDYWSATRHAFGDLPRGVPQAQAAARAGHREGRDQFGRAVTNPAGIDLADGTFTDGLGLSSNAWVDVTFLWQGDAATGVVHPGGTPVNVRTGPGTGYPRAGLAAEHARVPVLCTVRGQTVSGPLGTTDLWDRIGPDNYVSDAYLRTGSGEPVAPPC